MSEFTTFSTACQTFPTLFELEPVAGKKVTVDFSAPELSSLGGLVLVREYERKSCSIIERIESCINDPRFEPMVVHSQTEMLRQRVYHIMAGFEDADDCDRLCGDGILKMTRTPILMGASSLCFSMTTMGNWKKRSMLGQCAGWN